MHEQTWPPAATPGAAQLPAHPRLATNASQTVVWKLPPHEPFGTAQAQQDPDQDGIATDIPLRFAGQVFDADTGLHYNYFRDYDPWTGRYIQSDPIGLEGGLNTYGYVLNNPINLIDPLGLAPPQNIPPCVDVAQNIAEARNMSYGQWYDAVRNGGKWDYKQQGAQYQEFGNYNYGVTAKAVGIPGNIPNRGAGWAQGQAGTSCRIPDDCIDKNRYPLFMARSVLRELIESLPSTRSL